MSNQTYKRTETVQITSLAINGEDLREYLVAFNIYEDIFSNFLTCDITLAEHVSLTENVPIFGGETIVIGFNTHAADGNFDTITKAFICTGISNLEVQPDIMGQKGRVYTIKGISVPAYVNLQKRVNRPYKDQRECQIVKDIATNVLGIGKLRLENCQFERNIILPNIRPSEAIQLLSRSAIRQGTKRICNYIFYEDMEKFNFVPLDFLIEQSEVNTVTNRVSRHVTNEEFAKLNAEYFANSKNFDLVENIMSGMYGATSYGVNIGSKTYLNKNYIYTTEFPNQANIDGSNDELMDRPPSSPFQTLHVHPEEKRSYSEKRIDWNGVRRKMLQQFKNNKYIVETDGDTTIKVGDIVKFDLPSYDSTKDKDSTVSQELDKYLSGKYLIIHLRHYVTREEHKMIMTLVKNQRLIN